LIADEEHRKGIEKLTNTFKKLNTETILCYQLTHPGQISDSRISTNVRIYEPKGFDNIPGRLLSTDEIKWIRERFIRAAEIVYDSGADMVDIKLCHGYLGAQLVRPANTRNDEYGGSLENRMRFPREVIGGINERIKDPKFKIMVRLSLLEGAGQQSRISLKGSIGTKGAESTETSLDEPFKILRMLVDCGVDVINITAGASGQNFSWMFPSKAPKGFKVDNPESYREYHYLAFAKMAKELDLGVPIICSGFSIFDRDISCVALNSVLHGYADMIGIGRQTLVDPDTERILNGSAKYCVRCNGCLELLHSQMLVGCTYFDPLYGALLRSTRLCSRSA
jgi:2,4-dienoyl-CoA reductase-like NADH-dependent reductase (Old Yellow Enzyme family)